MKIESVFSFPQQIAQDNTIAKGGGQAMGSSPAHQGETGAVSTTGGDHARLSESAVLASAAFSQPDVRTDKITAIQQSLANGSYTVSASDLAEKLLNHLLQN